MSKIGEAMQKAGGEGAQSGTDTPPAGEQGPIRDAETGETPQEGQTQ